MRRVQLSRPVAPVIDLAGGIRKEREPMIDTLARHVAAVSEARRLLAMVLANNPAFAALAQLDAKRHEPSADPNASREPFEKALADDPYFKAYCHLTYAVDLLRPGCGVTSPASPALPISQQITALPASPHSPQVEPCAPIGDQMAPLAAIPISPPPLPVAMAPTRGLSCLARPQKAACQTNTTATPLDLASAPPLPLRAASLGERIRYVLDDPIAPKASNGPTLARLGTDASVTGPSIPRDEAQVSIVWREKPITRVAPVAVVREPTFLRLFNR